MHRLDAIEAVTGGFKRVAQRFDCEAELRPEPTNPHDANAVAVYAGGEHVAYLPRDLAEEFVTQAALIAPTGSRFLCRSRIELSERTNQHNGWAHVVVYFGTPLMLA